MRTLIGIVGYCDFVRGYPLGPELMQHLRALPWPGDVEICELNWGPLAIVQDLQARTDPPRRVVLIGALDRGLAPGSVSCRLWAGEAMEPELVQRRMFEAVTGVVSLDNLLVIGGHFGVWPAQTYTVELQWPQSGLGDLVLDEIATQPGRVVGERPLAPAGHAIVAAMADAARALVLDDPPAGVQALSNAQLTAVAPVLHHRFLDDGGVPP